MFEDKAKKEIRLSHPGEMLVRLDVELSLYNGSRNPTPEWEQAMKAAGVKDVGQLTQSIVTRLTTLAGASSEEANPSKAALREGCLYYLDMALFGSAPAENISPINTPYKGLAGCIEVAHPDRVKVYNHVMGLRSEIAAALKF